MVLVYIYHTFKQLIRYTATNDQSYIDNMCSYAHGLIQWLLTSLEKLNMISLKHRYIFY